MSHDGIARLWNVDTGQVEREFSGDGGKMLSVAVSPDGDWIVTGSEDGTAQMWDLARSQPRFASPFEHSASVTTVRVSPDGQWIGTGSSDRTVKLWRASSGSPRHTLTEQGFGIGSIAFSHDSRWIAASSVGAATVTVWDVDTGRVRNVLVGPEASVECLAFSPQRSLLVMGGEDTFGNIYSVHVWDLAAGRRHLSLQGYTMRLRSAEFSPDGRRIVTSGLGTIFKLWDVSTGRELLTLRGRATRIGSVVFSPDGQRIATASLDGTVRVWTAATDAQVADWQREEEAAARQLDALKHERLAEDERQRAHLREDEGAIKHWLVLGPIGLDTDQVVTSALEHQQIPREAQLMPSGGETVTVVDKRMNWRAIHLENYEFDFGSVFGAGIGQAIAYAVCYINSENAQQGLWLITGNRNPAKIYLNGQQVYERTSVGIRGSRDSVANLRLKAGVNVLVFKSVSSGGSWPGSLRFTDKEGNSVKGIQVHLAPTINRESED